jgi:hypothetical protein
MRLCVIDRRSPGAGGGIKQASMKEIKCGALITSYKEMLAS